MFPNNIPSKVIGENDEFTRFCNEKTYKNFCEFSEFLHFSFLYNRKQLLTAVFDKAITENRGQDSRLNYSF